MTTQGGPWGDPWRRGLVKFVCPITFTSRAPGRTGAGAGMGSKNLKSIVVRGTGKVAVKDPEGLKKLTQWGTKNVRVNVAMAGLRNTAPPRRCWRSSR